MLWESDKGDRLIILPRLEHVPKRKGHLSFYLSLIYYELKGISRTIWGTQCLEFQNVEPRFAYENCPYSAALSLKKWSKNRKDSYVYVFFVPLLV